MAEFVFGLTLLLLVFAVVARQLVNLRYRELEGRLETLRSENERLRAELAQRSPEGLRALEAAQAQADAVREEMRRQLEEAERAISEYKQAAIKLARSRNYFRRDRDRLKGVTTTVEEGEAEVEAHYRQAPDVQQGMPGRILDLEG